MTFAGTYGAVALRICFLGNYAFLTKKSGS